MKIRRLIAEASLLLSVPVLLVLSLGLLSAQTGNNPSGFGAFAPEFGGGASIAATTTSASATLTGNSVNDTEMVVYNPGTTLAFCRWGVGAQTAVAGDAIVPPGTIQAFYKGRGANTVACIMVTGSATIYLSPGFGR